MRGGHKGYSVVLEPKGGDARSDLWVGASLTVVWRKGDAATFVAIDPDNIFDFDSRRAEFKILSPVLFGV